MTDGKFEHEFVTTMPDKLRSRTIYVSMVYATAIHLCACGCGEQVVTPISPSDWTLSYDGESISLNPSIGNWRLPCRSHYWVTRSRAVWADDSGTPIEHVSDRKDSPQPSLWVRIKRWIGLAG